MFTAAGQRTPRHQLKEPEAHLFDAGNKQMGARLLCNHPSWMALSKLNLSWFGVNTFLGFCTGFYRGPECAVGARFNLRLSK
jgi:hypothetical protein